MDRTYINYFLLSLLSFSLGLFLATLDLIGRYTTIVVLIGATTLSIAIIIYIKNYNRLRKIGKIKLENTISHLKNAQAIILHQEKMASIGQLSAGVAHEINNPTGFVKINLEVMSDYMTFIRKALMYSVEFIVNGHLKSKDNFLELYDSNDFNYIIDDSEKLLLESLDGIKRISKIVEGLKDYARADLDILAINNPNDAVKKALSLSWNEVKYKAEVVEELGELPQMPCYIDKLTQVVINLLINSVQAIEKSGKIWIKTYYEDDMVYISVRDNGKGISLKDQEKIFDPFYTTKDVGVGTGLGLSICQGIVQKHGGNIEVKSSLGNGANFIIKLPVKDII